MNELTDTKLESLPWNEDLRLGLGFEDVVDRCSWRRSRDLTNVYVYLILLIS